MLNDVQMAALVRYIVENEKAAKRWSPNWKISSIKALRTFTTFGLKEAKDLVEAVEKTADPVILVLKEIRNSNPVY